MTLEKKPFENIVGKGENAGDQHFLLFPECFLTIPQRISVYKLHLFCRLHMLYIWYILSFGKGLKTIYSHFYSIYMQSSSIRVHPKCNLFNNKTLDLSKSNVIADDKFCGAHLKWNLNFKTGNKYCGRRGKCCLTGFSFSMMFSSHLFLDQ